MRYATRCILKILNVVKTKVLTYLRSGWSTPPPYHNSYRYRMFRKTFFLEFPVFFHLPPPASSYGPQLVVKKMTSVVSSSTYCLSIILDALFYCPSQCVCGSCNILLILTSTSPALASLLSSILTARHNNNNMTESSKRLLRNV